MAENKRAVGREYETRACAYLENNGFTIIERNFRSRTGEIDIVCREGTYLVFTEVKYRKSASSGTPAEAVGFMKQKKIFDTARFYLARHGISPDTDIRFDVVAILGENITLIRNAFSPL